MSKDLDAKVAECVMGQQVKWGKTPTCMYPIGVPPYSTDIKAAFEILTKPEIMDKIQLGLVPTSFGQWVCRSFMLGYDIAVQCENPCEAICRAALRAKGVE